MGGTSSNAIAEGSFASLNPDLQKFTQCSLAENTKKCYLSAEKQFLNFCHGFKIHEVQPLFPANELTICYFAVFLAKSVKHCTIKGYLSAIKHLHLKHGFDLKLHKFVRLQYILRGIKRYQGQEMRTRLPISLVHLELFYTLLHSQKFPDWNSKMLWAAICLAFFGFLRISEFTTSQQFHPAYNLCSGDVTFVPSIISPTAVRIGPKCSKTDPFRKGVCLTLGQTGSHICAVKALHECIVSCRPAQGPYFNSKMENRYVATSSQKKSEIYLKEEDTNQWTMQVIVSE